MILARSEGNPFFIEEVIRSLIDKGWVYHEGGSWKARDDISDIAIPDTIHGVIMERIDRLEGETKYVLQCASVIGRLFRYRLLDHLVQQEQKLDDYLVELEDKELVYEERVVPELEYTFRHALTQEAAYQGIVSARRREFHRQVAEGIEQLYGDRLEEFYERLAHHWELSGDKEKTLDYLIKSGQKAARRYLNDPAIGYYTRAIELAREMDITSDSLAEIYELRGNLYNGICYYEEAIDDLLEATQNYSNGTKRSKIFGDISALLGYSVWDNEKSIEYAQKALDCIDPEDRSRDAARAYQGIATAFIERIDFRKGEEWYSCACVDMIVDDPIKVGIYASNPESSFSSTRFEYFRIYRYQ